MIIEPTGILDTATYDQPPGAAHKSIKQWHESKKLCFVFS